MQSVEAEVARLVLETSRIAGLMVVAPFPWTRAPNRVRALAALGLAFIAHSGASPLPPAATSITLLVLAVPSEVILGAAMGFVARLSFAAAEVAGDFLAPMIGVGTASLFDPNTHAQTTPISQLIQLLTMSAALAAGVHRTVLEALIASFHVMPAGFVVDVTPAIPELVRLAAVSLEVALRVSMPVGAVLLLAQIALAFLSRTAPAMQLFSVGFVVTIVVGVLCLLIALPDMTQVLLTDTLRIGSRMDSLLGQMRR